MTASPSRRLTNTSVDQVFDVLRLLSRCRHPVTTADVSSRLGMSASTAHRVLATLEETGYVTRDGETAGRVLGIRAHELADALFSRFEVREVSLPFLRRLASAAGETAALSVRLGWYSLRIAGVEGTGEIHRTLGIGEVRPIHTPGARTLLACLPDRDIDRCIARAGGRQRTAEWERELRAALCAIRQRGHEIHHEGEAPRAGRSLNFPVVVTTGTVAAAVSIEGDPSQFDPRPADVRRYRQLVDEFEVELREYKMTIDPFAHLDSNAIELDGDVEPLAAPRAARPH